MFLLRQAKVFKEKRAFQGEEDHGEASEKIQGEEAVVFVGVVAW